MTIHSEEILRDVLLASIKEQRAKRRWGIFFKLILLAIVIGFFVVNSPKGKHFFKPVHETFTALIDVDGIISPDSQSNADNVALGMEEAFKASGTKGIILRIDSPGGTPVQASHIYNEIMRQRALHPHIKVYAVCTDICTSAAYYIASAADAVYANPSSLIGSIGVLMNGFGFTDALQKLGIQRRLLTAGEHKGFLDPFSPMRPEDEKIAQTMLNQVHQQFINDVKKGRGNRLKVNVDTFSGLAWTGQQALAQGLIDAYGSPGQVAREVIKAEHIEDFTVKPNPLDLFAERLGASFASHITTLWRKNVFD